MYNVLYAFFVDIRDKNNNLQTIKVNELYSLFLKFSYNLQTIIFLVILY